MNNPSNTPASLVITAFGGVRATARALTLNPSCVSRWQFSGRVPTGWQRRILEICWARGIDLTAHDLVFGR